MARIEAPGSADPALLTAAARIARHGHDFGLVDRLTASPSPSRSSAETCCCEPRRCTSSAGTKRSNGCSPRDRPVAADDPNARVQLVAMRVRNLMWGLHRAEEALAVNRAARERMADAATADELITDEALTLLYSNRPAEALVAALTELSLHSDAASPCPPLDRRIPALIVTGRCETAVVEADRAVRRSTSVGQPVGDRPSRRPRRVPHAGADGGRPSGRGPADRRARVSNGRAAAVRRWAATGSQSASAASPSSPASRVGAALAVRGLPCSRRAPATTGRTAWSSPCWRRRRPGSARRTPRRRRSRRCCGSRPRCSPWPSRSGGRRGAPSPQVTCDEVADVLARRRRARRGQRTPHGRGVAAARPRSARRRRVSRHPARRPRRPLRGFGS